MRSYEHRAAAAGDCAMPNCEGMLQHRQHEEVDDAVGMPQHRQQASEALRLQLSELNETEPRSSAGSDSYYGAAGLLNTSLSLSDLTSFAHI